MRFKWSIGRKSAPICAGLELVEATLLRCLAYVGNCLRFTQPLCAVPPTRKKRLGLRGAAETGGRGAWAPAGRTSLAARGWLPVLVGLSQTECVCLKSWRERSDREQTSVESCKSTWRAIRFLSRRDGQKGRRACGFSFQGHTRNGFFSSFLPGVGRWWGTRLSTKYTLSGGSVWMYMAFLVFMWKWMMYYEDLGMRSLTFPPSHPTGLTRASIWAFAGIFSSISFNN